MSKQQNSVYREMPAVDAADGENFPGGTQFGAEADWLRAYRHKYDDGDADTVYKWETDLPVEGAETDHTAVYTASDMLGRPKNRDTDHDQADAHLSYDGLDVTFHDGPDGARIETYVADKSAMADVAELYEATAQTTAEDYFEET